MSIGAVLVGVAAFLLLAAYVARPFRRVGPDLDQMIETQVARVRRKMGMAGDGSGDRDAPSEEGPV